ncbi:hypothetical protein [Shewanella ulleungensis]|uniref:hypothetical protein n=1 Tax=Shewanella ulleungensis TaxID=2282699 RepID=UPI003D78DF88
MDILGRPACQLRVGDSNPGSVSCLPGGVGRNIAENLARLGTDTRLTTAVTTKKLSNIVSVLG